LSKNFKLSEFTCKCGCGTVKIDMDLVRLLQVLRDIINKPINVAIGYRCPAFNASIPTASKNSQHMLGKAADIKVTGILPEELSYLAKKVGFTGVGVYDTWVHVDVRDVNVGSIVTWDYREKNKGRKICLF
jgi:uncharacterized protein YcbK (DUF882 family)